MSQIAKMLDKIESWCQENQNGQYEPMKPGLTREEIDSIKYYYKIKNWLKILINTSCRYVNKSIDLTLNN